MLFTGWHVLLHAVYRMACLVTCCLQDGMSCYMSFTGWHVLLHAVYRMACLHHFTHVPVALSLSGRPLMVLAPDHTHWHTAIGRTPLDEDSVRQRPPQQTDRQTCPRRDFNPQFHKRTAADPRVIPRGHRDRPSTRVCYENWTFGVPKGKLVTALRLLLQLGWGL